MNLESYIIYVSGTATNALNGQTSDIDYSGDSFSDVTQHAYDSIYNKGGGSICIKKGSYDVHNTIKLKANVNIRGEGYGTLLTNKVLGGPIFEFIEFVPNTVRQRTIIEKMKFTGGGTGTGSAIQTKAAPSTGPYTLTENNCFRDIFIEGMNSHGINLPSRVDLSLFDNILIVNCAGDGLHANYVMAACTFISCDFSQNIGNGFYSESGVGNYINLDQAAVNGQYGVYLKNESKSKIDLLYTEGNGVKGLYINGNSNLIYLGNIADGYINDSLSSSTIAGSSTHFVDVYQNAIWVKYWIRPSGTTFSIQDPAGNVIAKFDTTMEIQKSLTFRADYGGNFSAFTPPSVQGKGHHFFAQDTNLTNPSKRMYVSLDGSNWSYTTLT